MRPDYSFVGGSQGPWAVTSMQTLAGPALLEVSHLEMLNLPAKEVARAGAWILQGFTSNVRYAERREIDELKAIQQGLGRPDSTCAALLPIKKSAAWWALAQDERRASFEEQSHHTAIGLQFLPDIARQLHHCRDLGEPFDFLTWFEFAPAQTTAFNQLLEQLRATQEWLYVEREVDLRLVRTYNRPLATQESD